MPAKVHDLPGWASEEAITQKVKQLTAPYPGNRDFHVTQSTNFGSGFIHRVSFTGQDENPYEAYVFERKNSLTAYIHVADIVRDYIARISPWTDPEFIKLLMVGAVSLVLLSAILFGMFNKWEGHQISVLTGMFGTAFGYIVGKPAKNP